MVSRVAAHQLGLALGQSILVENITGAAGAVEAAPAEVVGHGPAEGAGDDEEDAGGDEDGPAMPDEEAGQASEHGSLLRSRPAVGCTDRRRLVYNKYTELRQGNLC